MDRELLPSTQDIVENNPEETLVNWLSCDEYYDRVLAGMVGVGKSGSVAYAILLDEEMYAEQVGPEESDFEQCKI